MKNNETNTNTPLTVSEVAQYLSINESYVDDLVANHGLPAISIGGRFRFDIEALQAWLDMNGVDASDNASAGQRP